MSRLTDLEDEPPALAPAPRRRRAGRTGGGPLPVGGAPGPAHRRPALPSRGLVAGRSRRPAAEDADAPDVLAATTAISLYDPVQPPDDLFPATVVGHFRAGGYVLVVTDHGVLLPDGPVRAMDGDVPIEVPATLVDGRQWAALKRPT